MLTFSSTEVNKALSTTKTTRPPINIPVKTLITKTTIIPSSTIQSPAHRSQKIITRDTAKTATKTTRPPINIPVKTLITKTTIIPSSTIQSPAHRSQKIITRDTAKTATNTTHAPIDITVETLVTQTHPSTDAKMRPNPTQSDNLKPSTNSTSKENTAATSMINTTGNQTLSTSATTKPIGTKSRITAESKIDIPALKETGIYINGTQRDSTSEPSLESSSTLFEATDSTEKAVPIGGVDGQGKQIEKGNRETKRRRCVWHAKKS